jgi:hypothetical protein
VVSEWDFGRLKSLIDGLAVRAGEVFAEVNLSTVETFDRALVGQFWRQVDNDVRAIKRLLKPKAVNRR